jgi:hypothetical protein
MLQTLLEQFFTPCPMIHCQRKALGYKQRPAGGLYPRKSSEKIPAATCHSPFKGKVALLLSVFIFNPFYAF